MKTPEDIINRFIKEEGVKFEQERDDWVIEAMIEYAQEQVKNCSIPLVSQQHELLLQAYKDGFQAAVDSLVGANEVVKNKTLQ